MSFLKKIGSWVKKNVNLRNTLNVVKYAANAIPGVGTAISAGIGIAQGVHDEAQARKEQERMEAEAIRQQEEYAKHMKQQANLAQQQQAQLQRSTNVSNSRLPSSVNFNMNNNNKNNSKMNFLDKLEEKTFKGARYVLFAIPILLFMFKDKIFGKSRRR